MNTHVLIDNTYRVISGLGAGGGGTVYKAWHTRLQKHVVIKEYKHGMVSDPAYRNEVEALKDIKNPYLPQVYDFITDSNSTLTIMEYIEGKSFDNLLAQGQRFIEADVIKWYSRIAVALEALHARDVCHRDIKPANIMLTPSGEVCLIDFNAAIVGGCSARFISRSLGYASPEQYELYEKVEHSRGASKFKDDRDNNCVPHNFDNKTEFTETSAIIDSIIFQPANPCPILPNPLRVKPSIDWRLSDIYSLGAAMYHILTGKRPHERATEVIPVSKLGRYGAGLVRIIEKSMQPNPSGRYTSATELAKAIDGIQNRNKVLSFLLTHRQ